MKTFIRESKHIIIYASLSAFIDSPKGKYANVEIKRLKSANTSISIFLMLDLFIGDVDCDHAA